MIAAFEILMFLVVSTLSVILVSGFLLKHSKKNDKLRKKVGILFHEEHNNKHTSKEN